ncbi:MAG: guanylate kinase [Pseudomonadota bacterium]
MNSSSNHVPVPGTLWIVSAPSGAGKTSLIHQLLTMVDRIKVSVSHTTRLPRVGEEPGVHYHFVDQTTFEQFVESKQFLEWALVFGRSYGTSQKEVDVALQQGQDVILEIDWQGAQQVMQTRPNAQSIFIFPPSIDALRNRLITRGKDTPEVIDRRLSEARFEMSHSDRYQYWVVNDQFDECLMTLISIIRANRYRQSIMKLRQPDLIEYLQ